MKWKRIFFRRREGWWGEGLSGSVGGVAEYRSAGGVWLNVGVGRQGGVVESCGGEKQGEECKQERVSEF